MGTASLKDAKRFWVYILLCDNETYYTGYTTDMAKRYRSHVLGTGKCKYTRSFKPVTLAQCWQVTGNKAFAMEMERHIKTLSREKKTKLISQELELSQDPRVKRVSKKMKLEFISVRER